ncbi:ribosome hibernation promotion factor [Rickettsiales bacterium]|nr:ribosome hibernation promotion factor [Rickettsiales bacterium]
MQVSIAGKGISIGSSLQEYIKTTLIKNVQKYFENAVSARVVASKTSVDFYIDIAVHESAGQYAKSEGRANNVYAAVDIAIDRINKKLRRYKDRIKKKHTKDSTKEVISAKTYLISSSEETADTVQEDSNLIIAENSMHIAELSVSEAVMQMDLASLPALLFINSESGRLNLVYTRPDGNIAWVDPNLEKRDKQNK